MGTTATYTKNATTTEQPSGTVIQTASAHARSAPPCGGRWPNGNELPAVRSRAETDRSDGNAPPDRSNSGL